MVVHEIGIPDFGRIQYDIRGPTQWDTPSHLPISAPPTPPLDSVSSSCSDKLVIVGLGHLVEFFLTKLIAWVIVDLPAIQQRDFLERSSSSSMTASSAMSASAYSTTASTTASSSMASAASSMAGSSSIMIMSLAYFTDSSCGAVAPRNSSDGIL